MNALKDLQCVRLGATTTFSWTQKYFDSNVVLNNKEPKRQKNHFQVLFLHDLGKTKTSSKTPPKGCLLVGFLYLASIKHFATKGVL